VLGISERVLGGGDDVPSLWFAVVTEQRVVQRRAVDWRIGRGAERAVFVRRTCVPLPCGSSGALSSWDERSMHMTINNLADIVREPDANFGTWSAGGWVTVVVAAVVFGIGAVACDCRGVGKAGRSTLVRVEF
ncbi:MAG: hypothetical protein KDB26_08130, partial [Microthrixaceae bacterium]|nr:hypothetical protein [Microthrixaceae bacterium]